MSKLPYILGLDIGIASVGWAVLACGEKSERPEKIEALGVRAFEKAEQPKTGASLALPRRVARSQRRRLYRRVQRLKAVKDLFVKYGLITEETLKTLYVPTAETLTPYELRAQGLDRLLTNEEFCRVLTQIAKRRGYKSMRLDRNDEKKKENGIIEQAIAENSELMRQKGYRTVGEMLARDEQYACSKRNRNGDYKSVVSRQQLLEELVQLFKCQRGFGNHKLTKAFEDEYTAAVCWQKPVQEGPELLALVGNCTFMDGEKRIAKACVTAEKFRLIDKINNIRWYVNGEKTSLTNAQRRLVYEKACASSSELTYEKVRKLLDLPEEVLFSGIRYTGGSLDAEKKAKLPSLKVYHEMRRAVEKVSAASWDSMKDNDALLDGIADVLTYYKREESVLQQLGALGISQDVAAALSGLCYSGSMHLSKKAIQKILPFMLEGMGYSDACAAAGFHHSQKAVIGHSMKLPPIPVEDIRNPVVLRALAQARKVVNAIVRAYGPPLEVHVELAREMSMNLEERREMERKIETNRAAREEAVRDIMETHQINPSSQDILKYRLWKEQDCRCLYTGAYIDPVRMFTEKGYAEIDHILPYSRSFDDSYMNKVLVLGSANQQKGSKTPFEAWGADEVLWHEIEERLRAYHIPTAKARRILRRNFSREEKEFRERNLNDTRYACRYFAEFLRKNLQFADDRKLPVHTVNGQMTAYLRARWGLNKNREENDLHHAMDAAVVAACTTWMVERASSWFKLHENHVLAASSEEYTDPITGDVFRARYLPQPWQGFTDELRQYMGGTALVTLNGKIAEPAFRERNTLGDLYPIFVSRMPQRGVGGELHKETIRRLEGTNERGMLCTSKKVPLQSLTLDMLEKMVGKETDIRLYEALKARLLAYNGNGKRAFAEPFVKPANNGKQGPLVKSIRVMDDPSSGGVMVRGGLADHGKMVRVDVFLNSGKKSYHLVPVYASQVARGILPNRAIVAARPESEWTEMDGQYTFCFSLYPGDLVRLVKKKKNAGEEAYFGYYHGCSRSTGAINIDEHDNSASWENLGVKTNVIAFEKWEVDVLGQHIALVKKEPRRGLS